MLMNIVGLLLKEQGTKIFQYCTCPEGSYDSHSSCKHIHRLLKEYAIKNIREYYVRTSSNSSQSTSLVLLDESCGENYSSFLDITQVLLSPGKHKVTPF